MELLTGRMRFSTVLVDAKTLEDCTTVFDPNEDTLTVEGCNVYGVQEFLIFRASAVKVSLISFLSGGLMALKIETHKKDGERAS